MEREREKATTFLSGTLREERLSLLNKPSCTTIQSNRRRNYNTCIICVLHFVPNGIKLRVHIGSELQCKAAGILSIETDDNPEYSVVKVIKVHDGSPLNVPMMLFGLERGGSIHIYRSEKSKEDKEKRKTDELDCRYQGSVPEQN